MLAPLPLMLAYTRQLSARQAHREATLPFARHIQSRLAPFPDEPDQSVEHLVDALPCRRRQYERLLRCRLAELSPHGSQLHRIGYVRTGERDKLRLLPQAVPIG